MNKCVDSVLNQTYKNLEVILVDDESPDNCGIICDEYAKNDNRIKVIHQENKGLSGARNSGLKIATGDFISFLDSDDWLDLDAFETIMDIANKHKLDIVEFDLIERKSENETSEMYLSSADRKSKLRKTELQIANHIEVYERIIKNTTFSVCRRIYKHNVIKNYLFLEGKTSEDVYFTMDNIKKFDRLGYFPFPFYNYRVNPTSITRKPYTLKDFDALDAAFHLYRSIMESFPEREGIKKLAHKHLLKRLLRHYKLLNYNAGLDPDYNYRKEAKKMIDKYYSKEVSPSKELDVARYLPMPMFRLLIGLHKIKLNMTQG